MRRCHTTKSLVTTLLVAISLAAGATAVTAEPVVTRPFDPADDCTRGLDSIGTVVAGGGDYNGDGIPDLAYSAPCAPVAKKNGAGRVWIRSGENGNVLARAKGRQEEGYFGAAMAFVADLNGDGKDELLVGAPGNDAPAVGPGTDPLQNAGQIRVLTAKRAAPYLRLDGAFANSEFGASVTSVSDMTGDGRRELLIGAPGEQLSILDSKKTGAVYLVNGKKGHILDRTTGSKAGQRFGTTVGSVEATDAQAPREFLITSEKSPIGGVLNAGAVEVRANDDPDSALIVAGGAKNDRLGASSDASTSSAHFIAGSPGWKAGDGLNRAGSVTIYSAINGVQLNASAEIPENNAQFGTGVAVVGDINNDTIPDFAASEPYRDAPADELDGGVADDVGRITWLSGADASALMSVDGVKPGTILGRSLAGGIDYNNDGTPDVISGNPGDSPQGRRGAGSVHIYSGADGSRLRAFKGTRGLETRIFAAKLSGATAGVRGFTSGGKKLGVNASVLDDATLAGAELSIDVLDRTQAPVVPGGGRVAVGSGSGAGSSHVVVLSAIAKKNVHTQFEAFPGEDVGANVAAGDVDGDDNDDLVVAEGSSATGDVRVRTFSQNPNDPLNPAFTFQSEFLAFAADDMIGLDPIAADGANVVVTGLRPEDGREIIAAPAAGLPVVRVFGQDGTLLLEWLAFDPTVGADGLSIAAIDMDGNGNKEIVVAPMTGPGLVRVFNDDGLPFSMPGAALPVQFLALEEGDESGVRIAAADVDFDGRQEILVVSASSSDNVIRAFEGDGSPVEGFDPIDAMNGATKLVITATDRFLLR